MEGLLIVGVVAYLVLVPLLLAGARRRIGRLEERIEKFQRQIASLQTSRSTDQAPEMPSESAEEVEQHPQAQPGPIPVPPVADVEESPRPKATETGTRREIAPTESGGGRVGWTPSPQTEELPGRTSLVSDLGKKARDWLLGGNTVARVGVIVLFFGVAFLLKYAADRGWFPIELRLAGAALGGMLLLGIGWNLRERRRNYALVLQGGGVGIVYLTVFAAVQLYQLVPPGPGLALMVVLVGLASLIAVLQDARSLAVLAMVGGFLAPVLVSRGGSHVHLFSYYAVLDAGILAIAWRKAWRELNLVGFVFTFVIGGVWGYRFYQPEYFNTTQPFLVLFFLFYVVVPVLFAQRQMPSLKGYVDGTLVFGVPLIAFGLQAALVQDFEYGLALSALAAGLFYGALASGLWGYKPENMRLLTEAFVALAVAFGTLAIPLAVDGRWTGSAWALEGAALVWVGLRQRRALARAFGLLVQLGAGLSVLTAHNPPSIDKPILNGLYLSGLMLALAGVFTAYQIFRHRKELSDGEAALSVPLLAWGLMWWYGGSGNEIWRQIPHNDRLDALLGLVTVSSAGLGLLSRRLTWPDLGRTPLLLLPVMAFIVLLQFADHFGSHPFARWGLAAWGAAFAVNYWLLRRHEDAWSGELPVNMWHSISLWLAVFILTWEGWWLVSRAVPEGYTWRYLMPGLVPIAVVLGLPRLRRSVSWPLQTFSTAYFDRGLPPLVAFLGVWVLHASLQLGDPRPLPYLPVLNPLELTQCLALLVIFRVIVRDWNWVGIQERWRGLMLVGFVVLNGMLARATHFLGGVPFDFGALWASAHYQAAVSITWTVIALAIMLSGTRLRQRPVWVVGAALLAAVVFKLFMVDLAGIGTVARIVSFIVVGVLILVIGFLSPLPPSSEEPSRS